MMIIDNLTFIRGPVLARAPHPDLQDYDVLQIRIDDSAPVEGRADLLSRLRGEEVQVAVRRELLGDAGPGFELRCRAKRIPAGAMCEPHPDSGDFEVRRV